MKKLPIGWKYIGDGAGIPDLPARDITQAEYLAIRDRVEKVAEPSDPDEVVIPRNLLNEILTSGLYEPVVEEPPADKEK